MEATPLAEPVAEERSTTAGPWFQGSWLELPKVESEPVQVSVSIADDPIPAAKEEGKNAEDAPPPKRGWCSCCCCCCCSCKPAGPRSKEDTEIVAIFQDKRRYGLPGSDGTILANWVRYVGNHDALMAILFSNRKNAYGPFKRFMLQFCIVAFTLYVNSLGSDFEEVGVIMSIIILQPVNAILDTLASLDIVDTEGGCGCMWIVRCCRDGIFWIIGSSFLTIFLVLAILSILDLSKDTSVQQAFVKNILISIFVSAAKLQILDIPNFLVDDWTKVPLLCGFNKEYSLFDLFCCRKGGFLFIVGEVVGFPKRTLGDDKRWFEEKYPSATHYGVVSSDDPNLLKPIPDPADAAEAAEKSGDDAMLPALASTLFSFLGFQGDAAPVPTQEPDAAPSQAVTVVA